MPGYIPDNAIVARNQPPSIEKAASKEWNNRKTPEVLLDSLLPQ